MPENLESCQSFELFRTAITDLFIVHAELGDAGEPAVPSIGIVPGSRTCRRVNRSKPTRLAPPRV
jgi:hypothetical protein